MFNTKVIQIIIPPGPYPHCGCGSIILPLIQPVTYFTERTTMYNPIPEKVECVDTNSAKLVWKCPGCGKVIE